MNSSSELSELSEFIDGTKGQTVCRSAVWTDVLKFFLFNYGLHVFTVLSAPGSGPTTEFVNAVTALLLPFSGTITAASIIYNFARGKSGDLKTAQAAGALCMVVPRELAPKDGFAQLVNLKSTEVHGQFPNEPIRSPTENPADGNESNPPKSKWRLVVVPKTFTVHQLAEQGSTPLMLSCNYSILQAVAAILQIIYGSLELYDASKRQIPKFGYAAYSLTVIPYVVMSLTNLLATLCEPQYPSLFLVLYRGKKRQSEDSVGGVTTREKKPTDTIEVEVGHSSAVALEEPQPNIIGAIGEAYGDLADRPEITLPALPRSRSGRIVTLTFRTLAIFLGTFSLFAPYVIIQLLTGFEARESTVSQRIWMMLWIVVGQVYGCLLCPLALSVDSSKRGRVLFNTIYGGYGARILLLVVLPGTAAIGGYVVVAQTMMQDKVCVVV